MRIDFYFRRLIVHRNGICGTELLFLTEIALKTLSCTLCQFNSECCAFAYFRVFHEYAAFMIFLNDSFCQRQSQAPAAFFSCKARFENISYVLFLYTFACVSNFNDYSRCRLLDMKPYCAASFHCIYSVFTQIFDYPFEERTVYSYCYVVFGKLFYEGYL